MFVALLGAQFFTPGSSTAGICGTRRAVTRGTERRVSVNKLRACQCVGELSMPICSMYSIFTYIWVIYGVNAGKYSSTMVRIWDDGTGHDPYMVGFWCTIKCWRITRLYPQYPWSIPEIEVHKQRTRDLSGKIIEPWLAEFPAMVELHVGKTMPCLHTIPQSAFLGWWYVATIPSQGWFMALFYQPYY